MAVTNGNMNSSVGWVPLSKADALSLVPGHYTVGSENIEVGGLHLVVPSKTWTEPNGRWIARGIAGSTAASHTSGATLTRYYPEAPGGSGATPTLAEVLAEGNETGANAIVMPLGIIDGRATQVYLESNVGANDDTIIGPALSLVQLSDGGSAQISAAYNESVGVGGSAYLGGPGDGQVALTAGDGLAGGANGGDINLVPGAGHGPGRHGLVFLNLPTVDPEVAGALWADSLVVKVSAG